MQENINPAPTSPYTTAYRARARELMDQLHATPGWDPSALCEMLNVSEDELFTLIGGVW